MPKTAAEVLTVLIANVRRPVDLVWSDGSKETVILTSVDDEGFVYELIQPDGTQFYWTSFESLTEVQANPDFRRQATCFAITAPFILTLAADDCGGRPSRYSCRRASHCAQDDKRPPPQAIICVTPATTRPSLAVQCGSP